MHFSKNRQVDNSFYEIKSFQMRYGTSCNNIIDHNWDNLYQSTIINISDT